jgi:thioester reductase-like protein
MKKVVIVGASGLLGSNILSILSENKNLDVTCLVRKLNPDNNSSARNAF